MIVPPEDAVSLRFGSMELNDPHRIDVAVTVLAEGLTFGNPQPIEVVVRSLIQNASNVITRGWDNREGTGVRVKFEATDLDKIAVAEQELMAEIGRRNTLTWTPPDGLGAPTQFVIVTSSFDYLPDDLAEVIYPPTAQYSIRLIPEAFPRSTITVRTLALGETGEDREPVDDCSSVTGWTGFPQDPTTDGDYVLIEGTTAGAIIGTRDGTIDTSILKYLEVLWRVESGDGLDRTAGSLLRAFAGATELPRVAQTPGKPDAQSIFLVPDDVTSLTQVRFERTSVGPVQGGTPAVRVLMIGDIQASDIRPSIGTTRQLNQVIAVEGSAPSEGTLVIEPGGTHGSSPLGEVLAYVYSDSYLPALRGRRISGEDPVSDLDTTVSGAYNTLASDEVYEISVGELPDGTHVLMAHLRYTGVAPEAQELSWTAEIRVDGVPASETVTGSTIVDFTALPYSVSGLAVVLLGDLQLPDWQLGDGSIGVVRLTIHAEGGADVEIDEGWLFNVDIGYLTHVACGVDDTTSGGPERLWLLPATIETNIPSVLIGTAADQSDAYHPAQGALGSWMPPYFEPPTAFLHLVTTFTKTAQAAMEHQPRWHTRARRVIGQ